MVSLFCWIIAEPIPVSENVEKTAVIAVIAAKYPKSFWVRSRDIMENDTISTNPSTSVTMVCEEMPFITLDVFDNCSSAMLIISKNSDHYGKQLFRFLEVIAYKFHTYELNTHHI